jgi:hypothetical protein
VKNTYLIDCLRFGAAGVAPGVDLVDLLVEIHGLWRDQQHDAAWERMHRVLPMLAFQMQDIEHFNATANTFFAAAECSRATSFAHRLVSWARPVDGSPTTTSRGCRYCLTWNRGRRSPTGRTDPDRLLDTSVRAKHIPPAGLEPAISCVKDDGIRSVLVVQHGRV